MHLHFRSEKRQICTEEIDCLLCWIWKFQMDFSFGLLIASVYLIVRKTRECLIMKPEKSGPCTRTIDWLISPCNFQPKSVWRFSKISKWWDSTFVWIFGIAVTERIERAYHQTIYSATTLTAPLSVILHRFGTFQKVSESNSGWSVRHGVYGRINSHLTFHTWW